MVNVLEFTMSLRMIVSVETMAIFAVRICTMLKQNPRSFLVPFYCCQM